MAVVLLAKERFEIRKLRDMLKRAEKRLAYSQKALKMSAPSILIDLKEQCETLRGRIANMETR